jgi:signal transduction histidine kinase
MRAVRQRPDPQRVDEALAALLTVGALVAIWLGGDAANHRLGAALIAPAITLPIAVRRRYPAVVAAAVAVLSTVDHTLWNPQFVGYPVALFCALYGLAVWTSPRGFAIGLGLVVTANLAAIAKDGVSKVGVSFVVVEAAVVLLVRRVVRGREQRAELAQREREVAAREAVVAERARIARELHDAIAHNVSMMVVQAGAERRLLDGENGSTREVMTTIEQIGRGALTEMRRLVGMLRSDTDEPLAPHPGLDDLPALVRQVREAGLPVDLHVDGERRDLPVGLELSAYRIVQEALINTLQHAGDARAAVEVRYGAHALELEIVDDGSGNPLQASPPGHGLIGMRERVAVYGGRFEAGRGARGGFTVRAVLPLQ